MIKCATVMSQDLFQQERKAAKRYKTDIKNFFYLSMFFAIRDPRWEKIRIRDKHPGSATLQLIVCTFIVNNELFLQK
jgi:hypothetical protein